MANREENLKKLNEQLNDEQLEQVAGGGYHSVAKPNQENPIQKPQIVGANYNPK